MELNITNKLDKVLNKSIDNKKVFGSVVHIESTAGEFSWTNSAGNLRTDTQYAIASITKMYTATVIIKLVEAGLLSFDDTVDKFFSKEYLSGLQKRVHHYTCHPAITLPYNWVTGLFNRKKCNG